MEYEKCPEPQAEQERNTEGDQNSDKTRPEPDGPGDQGGVDWLGAAAGQPGDSVIQGGDFAAQSFQNFIATARIGDEHGRRHAAVEGLIEASAQLGRHLCPGRKDAQTVAVRDQDRGGLDGVAAHGKSEEIRRYWRCRPRWRPDSG